MPKQKSAPQFEGFRKPTYTMVPDEIFDELLAGLTGAELKVLLYICRRTFGFKKNSDTISLNQIADGIETKDGKILDRGTGLSHRHVQRTVKSLEEKNIIEVSRQLSTSGDSDTNTYALKFLEGVRTSSPYPRDKMSLGVETPMSPTTNRIQETVNNTVNGNKSLLKDLPDLDQPKEKTEYVAQYILDELGDRHSENFYNLVAAKVPEDVIRRALAEIKQDGAANPVKVFTHRMKLYALEQLKGIS